MSDLSERISTAISEAVAGETAELRENLDRVSAQYQLAMEDRNWKRIFGSQGLDDDTGPDLDMLKDVSKLLREEIAGSALPKRAAELRYSYIFGRAFLIPGLKQAQERQGAGRRSALETFYNRDSVQRYVFGDEAKQEINTATCSDGVYLLLGNDKTKDVRVVPISKVSGVFMDPDFSGDVWAYQLTWTRNLANGKTEEMVRWVYTDRFTGSRDATIGEGQNTTVDRDQTIIDLRVNTQSGWAFGIPDLMAGRTWSQDYVTMVNHGKEVSATLAFYSAKVRQKSQKGAENMGLRLGQAGGGAGKTVAYGEGNEVDVFSTAGKTYDFGGLRPIAAGYAAAVGVSVVDLLADPGAAGSSYGSAQTLSPVTRRSVEARRSLIASWHKRIFKWAGIRDIEVIPASVEDTDPYRQAQVKALAWNTGLVHPEEARAGFLEVAGFSAVEEKAPEGVLTPNNSASLPRNDIDTDATPTTAASPDQGQSNGTGGRGTSDNDERTDVISQSLREMKNDEFLERFESLVVRMENASK